MRVQGINVDIFTLKPSLRRLLRPTELALTFMAIFDKFHRGQIAQLFQRKLLDLSLKYKPDNIMK